MTRHPGLPSQQDIAASTLSELHALVEHLPVDALPQIIPLLEADGRQGTTQLARTLVRRWRSHALLESEFRARWSHEDRVRRRGYELIAGVDEAGRGPLAGPVVAAAVILPRRIHVPAINDSKQLTAREREELDVLVRKRAVAYAVSEVGVQYIDRFNILRAAQEAMRRALARLAPQPDYVLVDGNMALPDITVPQDDIVDGDALSNSIAAASILAKVYRDRRMIEYHKNYPAYGFDSHKGYSTPEHLEALRRHGRSPIHRLSFRHVLSEAELGRWGEEQAARHLRERGINIVERNIVSPAGELDLVGRDGSTLVFVEVRTGRPGISAGQLLASIDLEKQARVVHAAMAYIARTGYEGAVRFDAVAVGIQVFNGPRSEHWVAQVTHVPEAFASNRF